MQVEKLIKILSKEVEEIHKKENTLIIQQIAELRAEISLLKEVIYLYKRDRS